MNSVSTEQSHRVPFVSSKKNRRKASLNARQKWWRRFARHWVNAFVISSGLIFLATAQAEKAARWRVFRAGDGLKDSHVDAITSSPRGNIWMKHADSDEISYYDGYAINTLPSPGKDYFRIYESRTRQLWSLYTNGLVIFNGSQWVRHPIPEIGSEFQADLLRQVRQIPLIPMQKDRVLFLLSDRLMEYDASKGEATVLKYVTETGLGKFSEMTEAREDTRTSQGGIWITGANGLAKISGPARQISRETTWEVQLIRDALQVENLQRPFEDDQGGVTTLAVDSQASNRRVVLHFDGTSWKKYPVEGEILRQAWPGWDKSIWACTINSLLRLEGEGQFAISRERSVLGQFKDVGVVTNGVFWLATSEGLVRCAPFLWRTPAEIESAEAPVHAAAEDSEGKLWFANSDSLLVLNDGAWKKIKWPENFEADFQPTDGLYFLRDGKIAIAAHDRPLLFDPKTERFQYLTHPKKRRIRLIGSSTGGRVWVQTGEANSTRWDSYLLEVFDGEKFETQIEPSKDWTLSGELFFAHETQNGDVWFGGSGEIGVYRNGHLQSFGPAQGFNLSKAYCLLELPDGKIWCGGADKILEFDGQRWTVRFPGLERVTSLVRGRNGKIWVASAAGVQCYWNGSWVQNGTEEGLPSPSIAKVLEDRHDRIWAATTLGISLYHPDADRSPPRTLAPRIESSSNGSSEGPITLVFNAVDKWQYTPVDRLLFSWRIDEAGWSSYTNATTELVAKLAAGKHRFDVRAMDRNWNADLNSVAFVEFSIVIPWYKEPRVIGISAAGLVLVLFFAGLAVNRHLQLTRSYAEVEKIVAIRTHELERANQELLQSQKMKALGTLAAGIAHDFNNILSIIKGSSQIIESHLDDKEKIRTRVDRIKTVVEQGSGIVKSMLGLSRVTEKDLAPCDLTTVVEDTIKLLGDRFLQEVTVRFEAGRDVPSVLGEKELIQQMLVNLILNGADAMMGTGEVVVRTGLLDDPPPELALSPSAAPRYAFVAVQDFGCGIAAEVLPRIFEPFFTTKAFSTRRGTGLGLSMVYELAKQLGYGLKVATAIGKGSTFMIIMPVKPALGTSR